METSDQSHETQGAVLSQVMTSLETMVDDPKTDPEPLDLMRIIRRGRPVKYGRPVEMRDFDTEEDTLVFAYDPNITPEPSFDLLDGYRAGEKVLTMNGAQMVLIRNARKLTLADVNLIEADIAV